MNLVDFFSSVVTSVCVRAVIDDKKNPKLFRECILPVVCSNKQKEKFGFLPLSVTLPTLYRKAELRLREEKESG